MQDQLLLAFQLLLLLGAANSLPILAKRILGKHFSTSLDGGLKFPDGRPIFGSSKTVRGVLLSILGTTLAAVLLGFEWITGAGLAAASMSGDLLSSFLKRRLGLRVHSQAIGLDQIPESLLPLLLMREHLGLGSGDIILIVGAFTALELALSRLLFKLHIRDRPY